MKYCILGMNEGENDMVRKNVEIKKNMVILKYCLLSKNEENDLDIK